MVQLSLTTTKGNSGTRHFPFTGFLGLTSIRVEGVVRTRFDEDYKPILAKAVTVSVRAYESRQTRLGGTHTRLLVDYSQTLWRKPDGQPYAELGEFESPFRIALPKRVAGFSTANYQDYRTYWRVEAVLEHVPIASVGSRIVKQFDLLLIRYDIPPPLPPPTPPQSAAHAASPSTMMPTLSHATSKPRAPVLHYNLSTPPNPIGPSDLLFTSVFIRPLDPSVLIRSASLLVERRIDLHDVDPPPPQTPPRIIISTSLPEREAVPEHAGFAYNAPSYSTTTVDSLASATSRTPLIPHASTATPTPPAPTAAASSSSHSSSSASSHKTIVSTVAAAEGTMFALDRETGVWSKTISLQWPAARSHSRWAMGETMRGSLGAVSFWVRVKVIVTSPAGTESVDLAPRELLVVLTNDAERRHALAQYAEMRSASGNKSRASTSPSPNPAAADDAAAAAAAAHRPAPLPLGYTPPKSAGQTGAVRQSSSSHGPRSPATPTSTASQPAASSSKPREKTKKPRRPHTSAGPRDSVDVRLGGGVPVPSPAPVPTNGYASSSSAGQSTGRARSSSSARYSPDHDSSEGAPAPGPDADAPAFRTLNTEFTGLNGIGGPRAMALRRAGRASPPREDEGLLVAAEFGAGVRMERVQTREGPAGEDKSELIRAWEEELVRIEKASRRSSNVLAFWRRKEKPRVAA